MLLGTTDILGLLSNMKHNQHSELHISNTAQCTYLGTEPLFICYETQQQVKT